VYWYPVERRRGEPWNRLTPNGGGFETTGAGVRTCCPIPSPGSEWGLDHARKEILLKTHKVTRVPITEVLKSAHTRRVDATRFIHGVARAFDVQVGEDFPFCSFRTQDGQMP
jgi:hypothetical protein